MAGTPEDFRPNLSDNNLNVPNFLGKKFNQAFSFFKQPYLQEKSNLADENKSNFQLTSIGNSGGIPLNAYLTYVTLKLNLIMQGSFFNYFKIDFNSLNTKK